MNARRPLYAARLGALLLLCGPGPARAALPEIEEPQAQARPGAQAGALERAGTGSTAARAREDERARAALERGLLWLAQQQRLAGDGSLPATGLRRASAALDPGWQGGHAPLALTALAALAWMAGGSPPERGVHGAQCAVAIDWLLARAELDAASPRHGYLSLSSDALSRMHGHALATLALAQAWSDSPRSARGARLAPVLSAAVNCIVRGQGVEGGWYYEPRKTVAHETSVTVAAVQALRAARDAGLGVDVLAIDRALDYVARARQGDGSFRYALGDERTSVAMTAAAVLILNAAGRYRGSELAQGRDWIARRLDAREAGLSGEDFVLCPHYERLYLAQALWQDADLAAFERWWRREIPRLLATQRPDGGFGDERFGDVYATSMACLVLALPQGLLPIFQR